MAEISDKDSALINMIADYFNDRYGTAMIENELKEVLEEDTPDETDENRKIAEILRSMGKEN